MSQSDLPLEPAPQQDFQAPKGALLVIFLIVFIDLLGFGLIIPLLPFYAIAYSASPFQVELLMAVYSFCQFIASPILGIISDRFGRRPVLIVSQIGSIVGYLLLGWATHHHWAEPSLGLAMIYLSRVIDGLSGGNISTAAAYISDVTGPTNRAKGMGMIGAAFGLGFIFGPGIGGVLGHINESLPAYAAAALSATAALVTIIKLKEARVHRHADSGSWLHPRVFLPLLRRKTLLNLIMIWFTCMAAYTMMDASAAMFLKDIFGFNALHVGLYFAFVGSIIAVVQGTLIGKLTRRASEWIIAATGVLLVSIGACGTLATAWQPALWLLAIGGVITAAGRSMQQPTISSLVTKHADRDQQGVAIGLFQGMGSLARGCGPVIGGLLYGTTGAIHPIRPYVTASALLLGAAIWTYCVRDRADMK